jgi:hypothetical protein
MSNKERTSSITSEKKKKVKFNLNISSNEDSQRFSSPLSPSPKKKNFLTHTSILKKGNIINANGKKEKIILLEEVKAKNRFNTAKRLAILTNSSIYVYNSKEKYSIYKENPYKIFMLKDYKFEVDNTILIIKKKEEENNEAKYSIVKKYEFKDKETAIKWWEIIISSIALSDINTVKTNSSNMMNEELNNSTKRDSSIDYLQNNNNDINNNKESLNNKKSDELKANDIAIFQYVEEEKEKEKNNKVNKMDEDNEKKILKVFMK